MRFGLQQMAFRAVKALHAYCKNEQPLNHLVAHLFRQPEKHFENHEFQAAKLFWGKANATEITT